jgi:hypothetical protein
MTISKELVDELLSGVERPEDLLGDKGSICSLDRPAGQLRGYCSLSLRTS